MSVEQDNNLNDQLAHLIKHTAINHQMIQDLDCIAMLVGKEEELDLHLEHLDLKALVKKLL
jgi:hypothetical protein